MREDDLTLEDLLVGLGLIETEEMKALRAQIVAVGKDRAAPKLFASYSDLVVAAMTQQGSDYGLIQIAVMVKLGLILLGCGELEEYRIELENALLYAEECRYDGIALVLNKYLA